MGVNFKDQNHFFIKNIIDQNILFKEQHDKQKMYRQKLISPEGLKRLIQALKKLDYDA